MKEGAGDRLSEAQAMSFAEFHHAPHCLFSGERVAIAAWLADGRAADSTSESKYSSKAMPLARAWARRPASMCGFK
jgi:hypothetical protein